MRKAGLLILVLAIACGNLVYAQEDMEGMNHESQSGQSGMMGGKEGKGKMMGMMQNDSVVATSDGGVVIKQGPRLIKYDNQLNLVKEVELPRGKKPESSEVKSETSESEIAAS